MKRVRFQTPERPRLFKMNDPECHSPRPFIEREQRTTPPEFNHEYPRVLVYSNDPVHRYENSNSSPYPSVRRTSMPILSDREGCWKPSDELNLSLLDASNHEPRPPTFCKSILKERNENEMHNMPFNPNNTRNPLAVPPNDMNTTEVPPNVLVKDNSFFIKRDNLVQYNFNMNPLQTQLNKLSLGKENNPCVRKAEMIKAASMNASPSELNVLKPISPTTDECMCQLCYRSIAHKCQPEVNHERLHCYYAPRDNVHCVSSTLRNICSHHDYTPPVQQNVCKTCNCHTPEHTSPEPVNAVDRKTWVIEKYEQSKKSSMEVEKQTKISKEKREPTVADLFKIIKLQNEQLQLLQEKVDKFMCSSRQNTQPTFTCSKEHVAVNSVENDQHKLSIGVMTSFEMIRTSTVINKEVVKQTNDNSQIQCNRSQISIKEVVAKPVNVNFLDGIRPNISTPQNKVQVEHVANQQNENACEEKTLNEISLYNVQVDNATTPLMSPEQTLYLDVRDYSESEASSNDQSNVGWTYYNKVMTHVNGMLQDSEMPSSASAMFRNMRHQCVQMQVDKTNVSVTKRVKFGDDPLGLHQPHIYSAPTDTSLKMNQLAAKYLKNVPVQIPPRPPPVAPPVDMSLATRNYMEKHRLVQGFPVPAKSPHSVEIPKFLDITALKQQPKFL